MNILSWVKRLFVKSENKFYWLDTDTHRVLEINESCIGSNGEPAPPMDCIKIKEGTVVQLYESKTRGTHHLCVGGRALNEDSVYGLYCLSDFDTDNYEFIRTIPTSKGE